MLVTIGITTYDRIELLEDTINSVLKQTFSDFKILVGNDNPKRTLSFDNLRIPRDERIEFVNHQINLGEIQNLNWLMDKASTRYFTWLADDDLLHPRFLEILLPILENESECNAVYTNYLSDAIPPDSFSESTVVQDFTRYTTQEFLLRYSNRSLILIGCYGLFVLEKLREMGGFRHLGSGYSPGGDTLIPILLSKNSSIYYLDQQLVFFRSHPNSMSINSDSMDSFITAEIDFINYASGVIAECAPDIGKRIYSQFRMWFQDNHFTVARRQSGSKLSRLVSQFIKSESQNYSLFRKFEIGFLLDVRFFASAIRRLVLRILGDAIFPVTRRKLQFFFRL